jgi:hypothetical protein
MKDMFCAHLLSVCIACARANTSYIGCEMSLTSQVAKYIVEAEVLLLLTNLDLNTMSVSLSVCSVQR